MPSYYISPRGLSEWRSYFEATAKQPAAPDWPAWCRTRDAIPYNTDLAPWLDGLCRIPIPAELTKSGNVEEWVFSPDLVEVYPDTDRRGFPKTAQEAIDRVYSMAGTAD